MSNDELRELLLLNCSNYLTQLKNCKPGNILLRGSFQNIPDIKKFEHNLEYRKPLHTPTNVHNLVNETFENKFGWKIRNGAFCYGFNINTNQLPKELGYGAFFIFCPIGNFKFVYSPTMFDMYGYISITRDPIEYLVTIMDFKDSTLCSALESGERKYENVSNEISVFTNSYYLINYSCKDIIYELIWNFL